MQRIFSSLDELIECVNSDKATTGIKSEVLDRYPIRFILFDNFKDSFDFIDSLSASVPVEGVDKWLDSDSDDELITSYKLAERIDNEVKTLTHDLIITPFSELARFYDNEGVTYFDSLIETLKTVENTSEGSKNHRRVYIPIVGLEGKMEKYQNEEQIWIWRYTPSETQPNYRLILTPTCYGVQGLEKDYTVVRTVKEWLELWREPLVKSGIICMSPSIIANAIYARPDNAFDYPDCKNAHSFLTQGLNLSIKLGDKPADEDIVFWEELCKEIDLSSPFDFDKFFNKLFKIHDLSDGDAFIEAWFKFKDDYHRWLLVKYYANKVNCEDYLCLALRNCQGYTDRNLFFSLATTIFSLVEPENFIGQRGVCMAHGARNGVCLTAEEEGILKNLLETVASDKGYSIAIRYFTPLTEVEKELAISWLGASHITTSEVFPFYPDLYFYLSEYPLQFYGQNWLSEYFQEYKKSKIANSYSQEVSSILNNHSGNPISFNLWYQDFKTTRTILSNRNDIEVIYWIDGLGLDWVSFIANILQNEEYKGTYLNEVIVAKALLPTVTSKNKEDLLKLYPNLKKTEDIDERAHKPKEKYPKSIYDELAIVKTAILKILGSYAGKTIAIVSDHGMTYLSQLVDGYNLSGVESDHSGRVAISNSKPTMDDKYFILEDGKTLCSLSHHSLCERIHKGQGAHGGATPEEVLIPILIISSRKQEMYWTGKLISSSISDINPILEFEISGLKDGDIPYVEYATKRYSLKRVGGDKFISDRISFNAEKAEVTLIVGGNNKTFWVSIQQAAQEDDLFGSIL